MQPVTLVVYSYGFYILVIGAVTSFFGGAMPEEARVGRAILRIGSLFAFLAAVLVLAIFLAPLLIE